MGRGAQGGHHGRRARHAGGTASRGAGDDRWPGRSVRLLHVRARGLRRRAPHRERRPVRGRGPHRPRPQPVPVRRPQPRCPGRARGGRADASEPGARPMTTAPETTPVLSPSLTANPLLGDWLRVLSCGVVEVRSGKVELGQGVLTALAQVAAEELDVDVARVEMTAATTDLSPDEGLTAGSLSIQHSGAALRQVCAEVRDIYVEIAAARWDMPVGALTVQDGTITAPDGRT